MSPPSAPSAPPPTGCKVLYEGPKPVADIVFVHGLCGHQTNTWTKNGVCWPKDLLPKEFSNSRIIAFGYDGNLGAFSSQNSISQHSANLLKGLGRVRAKDKDRRLIFVAHSIGGLVVKKILYSSHMEQLKKQHAEPELASILKATEAVIFIGTPHRGGNDDAWRNVIGNLATAVSNVPINHILLDELKRNSPTLDDMGTDFSKIYFKNQFKISSYFEELPMQMPNGKICKVVEKDSAVIGDARESCESIHANHIDIVRFDTKEVPGYEAIVFSITRAAPEAKVARKGEVAQMITDEEPEESIM